MRSSRPSLPWLAALVAVGMVLGGLLVGYEPVGADPDLLYRPIKSELARALAQGGLPYWSDRFGLGVPLVAESHAAAFYPPNWVAYRLFDVATAYRLLMWLHHAALVAATYAYARVLNISSWGAALAAVAFALCGFQASHAGHEPLYHVLPYLPLGLFLADRYAATGRLGWLAGLALAWGAQLTLGHFQVQLWTGGLVLVMGGWRVLADGYPRLRLIGLGAGVAWGAAVAAVQLALTWELTLIAGFARPFDQLARYAFPPAHLAQPALPGWFLWLKGGPENTYWATQLTNGAEASLYVGTVPLLLAGVGFVTRGRLLTPWRAIIPLSVALATMPRWWPDGYWAVTQLPGLGWFRCPARYTAMTQMGLCLLAGHGFDRAVPTAKWRLGLGLAVSIGVASAAWLTFWVATRPDYHASLGASTLPLRAGATALAWGLGMASVIAWRRGAIGPGGPLTITVVELAMLYYSGPVAWGWSAPFPGGSRVLAALDQAPVVGLVAGRLEDLPVRAGLTVAYPYLGITPPPPNYLLEASRSPDRSSDPVAARWLRRFGVTHGVWHAEDAVLNATTQLVTTDPVLDRLLHDSTGTTSRRSWKVVRYADPFPPAWATTSVVVARGWPELYGKLSRDDATDAAWYVADDAPPPQAGPRARSARVTGWDGTTAVVAHDGVCTLIVRRTWYPGWTARVEGDQPRRVFPANGGLLAVVLEGAGTHRVRFHHRPTALGRAASLSAIATATALLVIGYNRFRPRAKE